MTVFISSLIRGMKELESVAGWVDGLGRPDIGVELIAFTHDGDYWRWLRRVLEGLSCPVSFHGPYIGTEGTSEAGSEGRRHLMDSYRRVFELAREFGARHVVYHTTQLAFTAEAADAARERACENAEKILALSAEYGVGALVENLAYPPAASGKLPLFTNEQYAAFFGRYPQAPALLDIGHSHINGLDLEGFLKKYADRVRAYHFHNNDGRRDQHNDILHGTFSYEAFAPLCRRYTPDADIVLEYEPHVNLSWDELRSQAEQVLTSFG